jgi:hypothetical protein
MMMLMVLIVMRGALHDDVHMQGVFPVVLALCRPRRSERPPGQTLQPSEVGMWSIVPSQLRNDW